jgi:hypothetical protein
MGNKHQLATIPAHTSRRMLRRLVWTLGLSIVRGVGYATGATLTTVVIWWLTSR